MILIISPAVFLFLCLFSEGRSGVFLLLGAGGCAMNPNSVLILASDLRFLPHSYSRKAKPNICCVSRHRQGTGSVFDT